MSSKGSHSRTAKKTGVFQAEFCLALVRKIKHELYSLLEEMVDEQQPQHIVHNQESNQNQETQQQQHNATNPIKLTWIDPLKIMQSQTFEKYEKLLQQLVLNDNSSGHNQDQTPSDNDISTSFSQDKQIQVQLTIIEQAFCQLEGESVSFTSNPKQCSCGASSMESKRSQIAHRQLEYLIKEKQLNRKITQLSTQLAQTKNILEEKQAQIHRINQQLSSLMKLVERENSVKMRQERVRSLRDKIEMESLKRELLLERERDGLEMMIEKQNIHSNHQIEPQFISPKLSSTTKINKSFNSNLKNSPQTDKHPEKAQNQMEKESYNQQPQPFSDLY